jgi:2-dehydro-3-deoxyphosphogluconate aldolase / (4S)-4-hydroxy-2-oxoglutarate aldolase
VTGTVSRFREFGVLPVVVIDRPEDAPNLGAALLAGGLPCAEVTFRTPAAGAAIRSLAFAHPEVLVGAGSVLSVEQAEEAVAAGARFVVSPGLDLAVVDWCIASDVPVVPGVMTPTEVTAALGRGLHLLKFFPAATAGGPAAVHALSGPFPDVEFIPTGGIGPDNLADYLRLPMVAACGATWPVPRALIARGEFDRIEELVAEAVALVAECRRGR